YVIKQNRIINKKLRKLVYYYEIVSKSKFYSKETNDKFYADNNKKFYHINIEFQTVRIDRHILSRFGCWNRCEVFEGTSVRSCCDKQPCLLFLFGKGSVRSSEGCVADMT
ncbi:hypothetical protein BpHYR1_024726, partial [Brachionus plicatilis]